MEIKEIHSLFLKCGSVSIDTRKISQGCLFVALKGDRFDANQFAAQALAQGASHVVIDDHQYYIDQRTILVDDALQCLQQLAKFHRQYLDIQIIALTGSNGKTTTKELINVVLGKKYVTVATVGNLNNHIGVPLTLLSFTDKTEIGIVEMGANHQHEIEFLCEIASPDFGYITNFGKAHLEGFGGVEGVIKGKSELYANLLANDKLAFVNLDDPIQSEKTNAMKRHTFGVQNSIADVNAKSITADPFVVIHYDDFEISSNLIGLYNGSNVNAAVAIGQYFNVPSADIKLAIEHYVPDNNRSQLVVKDGREIILDAYNANPSSMAAAIAHFCALEGHGKVVVLGDMFELGTHSLDEHQSIVSLLSGTADIDVWFVGNEFVKCNSSYPHLRFYADFDHFKTEFQPGAWTKMLIKGSRGMALERTLQLL